MPGNFKQLPLPKHAPNKYADALKKTHAQVTKKAGEHPAPGKPQVTADVKKKMKTKQEADSSSTFAQMLRPGIKKKEENPSSKSPAGKTLKPLKVHHRTAPHASVFHRTTKSKIQQANHQPINFLTSRIREAAGSASGDPNRFEVILIQEGLGNLRDLFYYSAESIQSAASVFEGKKIYADHPDAVSEKVRPERSVRDILGYFENVEATDGGNNHLILKGDLVIMPGEAFDWARQLMEGAVLYSKKYQDQDFIGLSINANGEADEVDIADFLKQASVPPSALVKLNKAVEDGAQSIRVVSAITDAVSCDLVTEAGAGGRVLAMIEQEKKMKQSKMMNDEDEAFPPKKKNLPAGASGVMDDEGGDTDDSDDAGASTDSGGDHADASQDKQLIMQMLKKYVGGQSEDESEAESEGDLDMAAKAMRNAHEMGYEGEDAMKCAANVFKNMKHEAMKAAKQAEDEAKQRQDEAEDESESEGEDECKQGEDEAEGEDGYPPPPRGAIEYDDKFSKSLPSTGRGGKGKNGLSAKGAGQQESKKSILSRLRVLEGKVLRLSGENAALKEAKRKEELSHYLDQKLGATKLPHHATKAFKESGASFKSKAEIDAQISMFVSGYKANAGSVQGKGFVINVEKIVESAGSKMPVDLSKFIKKT
jgi:hypothetical protein